MAEQKTYYATDPIQLNGVLAFGVGDKVPADHVRRYGYDKQGLVSTSFPDDAATTLQREADLTAAAEPSDAGQKPRTS